MLAPPNPDFAPLGRLLPTAELAPALELCGACEPDEPVVAEGLVEAPEAFAEPAACGSTEQSILPVSENRTRSPFLTVLSERKPTMQRTVASASTSWRAC